jgi:hypothetical protein
MRAMVKKRASAESGVKPSRARPRVSLEARKRMYESFQVLTDDVRSVLYGIVMDEEAADSDRIAAGKEILSRGWGAVPQMQVIEAMFQHQHTFNMDAIRQMPADQLQQLEAALVRVMQVSDAEVIDATPNESPYHASERVLGGPAGDGEG